MYWAISYIATGFASKFVCVVLSILSGQRTRWSDAENSAIAEFFADEIKNHKKVTAAKIREVKEVYPCLSARSDAQIRTKINNIVLHKSK